jgi:hypothetical protein
MVSSEPIDSPQTLGKENFDDIYVAADPRPYYHGLGALDYVVPQHGKKVFQQVLDAHPSADPLVIDLCCSYGVNAALLKHHIELDDLYDHYRGPDVAPLSRDELADLDRQYFAQYQRNDAPDVVGIDCAGPAVEYAVDVGIIDAGLCENLEIDDASRELRSVVGEADVITVTGGIGYVTDRTFARMLDSVQPDRLPWVAALCLRTVPFDPIADQLSRHGLVTEQLDDVTFPQRRFANATEQNYALRTLADRGVDPEGREADGSYHVNVYLARPADHVADVPVAEIFEALTAVDPSAEQ